MASANMYPLTWKDAVCGTLAGHLQQGAIGAVLTTGYTFDADNHHFVTDAMKYEIIGTGYVSLGNTVTTSTVSYDTASNEIRWLLSAGTTQWTTASFTCDSIVFYDRVSGGTTTSWPMLAVCQFGTQTVTAGTFQYNIPATGQAAITGF